MIDTIVLMLNRDDFRIKNHDNFTPSTEGLYYPPYTSLGKNGFIKCTYNPTKNDIGKHGYLPRLTVFKAVRRGGIKIFMNIEFSIPKLLFGNNFSEVEESDFGEICWKLHDALLNMGIVTSGIKIISNSQVSTVHYSKNIVLTDYSTPYTYLRELAKINAPKYWDTNQSDFRNEGHLLKFHGNDYEVVFYDKLKDLNQAKKSERRAVEKDNYIQLGLFDELKTEQPFEVLRVEIRLNSKKRIQKQFSIVGISESDFTFCNIFRMDYAKTLIKHTFEELVKKYPRYTTSSHESLEKRFIEMQLSNPNLSIRKLLTLFASSLLIDEVGVRKFRDLTKQTNWYRLNRDLRELKDISQENPLNQLSSAINNFHKTSIDNYSM